MWFAIRGFEKMNSHFALKADCGLSANEGDIMKTLVVQGGLWFLLGDVALTLLVKFDASRWWRNEAGMVVALMVIDNVI